ncbi:MAG: pectinesterase family protein [Paludibacteraceae bacterium]
MKKTLTMVALACTTMAYAGTTMETKLYSTNFQDWDAISSSTTPTTKNFTTAGTNETLAITLAEVDVSPTGTNAKFTNTEVITAGYAMAAKTATPYIETSVLKNVTRVHFVHAATGGSRGWGLMCKTAEATKWDTLSTAYCAQAGTAVDIDVKRENVQLRWYNLNGAQNAYMTEMAIYGNMERDFTNFEIDLTQNPIGELPADVTQMGYSQHGSSFNGSTHGWCWVAFKFAVDGPVKVSLGGCGYAAANSAYVCSAKKDLNEDGKIDEADTYGFIDTRAAGCYDPAKGTGIATWVYNYEEADTLIVYCGEYCPYIKVEACAFVPDYVITYFDQDDNELGRDTVQPGAVFSPKYTAADLTIADGMAFRGWVTADGIKKAEGSPIDGDLKLYANVTAIETATVGTHYKYDLSKSNFYMEDHELIAGTGKYHSNHGFVFQNGQEMTLTVSPKAYVTVGLCTYTNTSDQIIRNAAGDSVAVMHVIKYGEEGATADGALCSFFVESTKQDTLHFNFTTTSYIHSVEVYNVAAPLNKVGHTYDIAAGDAATLMMVCNILEDGDTILLHDGVYDLGETVLTTISASRVVVKGESMAGTIIKNAPDVKTESINNTATILNTGSDNIFESLTLQNALDYYKADNGRAVCLQDKGTHTACYSVRMLSYQDTYYSNKPGQQCWFEDCEIHGTVDFICGSGSVYFYNTLLYCEKRASSGGGSDCITANNSQTAQGDKGYVFDRCTIQSECPVVSLSRSWNDQPQVAYLLTTLDMSKGEFSLSDGSKIQRWTIDGMNNCVPYDFSEYNTMDTEGKVISPASNKVQFFGKAENEKETIIGYEAAEAKSYTHFFREGWAPARNYVAFPSPSTQIEHAMSDSNTPAKIIRNGQLIILQNGIAYSILGTQL